MRFRIPQSAVRTAHDDISVIFATGVEPWDDRAVELLHEYLRHPHAPQRVTEPGPIDRCVPVYADTWRPWFSGHHGPTAWSAVATATLDALQVDTAPYRQHERRWIDRDVLLGLSSCAADCSDDALVALLVAVMLWGSGTSNGRGPRYTLQALQSDNLVRTLGATADLVRAGQPGQAHGAFRIRGIGAPFFTKWFWAVGLASTTAPKALILDSRVIETLYQLTGRTWRASGAHYVDYVHRLDRWARILAEAPGMGSMDAEKIEWLLFDRRETCLNSSLTEGPTGPSLRT